MKRLDGSEGSISAPVTVCCPRVYEPHSQLAQEATCPVWAFTVLYCTSHMSFLHNISSAITIKPVPASPASEITDLSTNGHICGFLFSLFPLSLLNEA